jgi:hypothetical protein
MDSKTFDGPPPSWFEPPDEGERRDDPDMTALSDAGDKARKLLLKAWAHCKHMSDDVDVCVQDAVDNLDDLVVECENYNAEPKEAAEPDEDQMPGRDR